MTESENKFYKDGLRFECNNCSRCCRFKGGVVFLSQEDLENLSKWAGLTCRQFIEVYCRKVEDNNGRQFLVLKTLSNGDCVFWDKEIYGCQAYQSRPCQCRTYPFWTKILKSEESWQREKINCPGIGCGPLHTFDEIQKELEVYENRKALN